MLHKFSLSPLKLIALSSLTLVSACATLSTPTDQQNIAAQSEEEAEASSLPPWAPQYFTPVPMASAPLTPQKKVTRLTFGSCFDPEKDDNIWHQVEAAQSDAFLFIGDNVYGDVHLPDPGLPELRDKYGRLAASPAFAQFRNSTPVLPVWDDHDYGLNDAGKNFRFRKASEELFNYVWNIPADSPRRSHAGVYDSIILGSAPGQRVQIILLDTRYFRDDLKPTDERNAPGKERYLPDPDPAKTMLGQAQWQWLENELQKPADIRLIASSIQIIADGHGFESWRMLPRERQKLFDLLNRTKANGVILLSGDRHAAGLYENPTALAYPLYEITSSSLNLPLSAWVPPEKLKQEAGPYRLGDNYFEVNFGAIDFNWEDNLVTLTVMNDQGEGVMSKTIPINTLRP